MTQGGTTMIPVRTIVDPKADYHVAGLLLPVDYRSIYEDAAEEARLVEGARVEITFVGDADADGFTAGQDDELTEAAWNAVQFEIERGLRHPDDRINEVDVIDQLAMARVDPDDTETLRRWLSGFNVHDDELERVADALARRSPALYDADTNDRIAPATDDQIEASAAAGETGIILVDSDGTVLTPGTWAAEQPGVRHVYAI